MDMEKKEELLKGLSIEELEERSEFAAAAAIDQGEAEPGWCNPCPICSCDL
jgi:hypothetical protein